MQSKATIAYLSKQYRLILKKCFLISVGAYALLGAGYANAGDFEAARDAGGTRDFTLGSDYGIGSKGSSVGIFNVYGNLKSALSIDDTGNLIVDATNASAGDNVYEFDGQGLYNLIESNRGVANLSNLVMKNGSDDFGAGFSNQGGSGTITNSSFLNNAATSNGGGISTGTSTLNIYSSSFIENEAAGRGGAISNGNSTANVESSVFLSNSAGAGGAIANRGALDVTSSTFTSNTAINGGAINQYVQGSSPPLKTTVTGSTFTNNSSTNLGGAIYSEGGVFEIINSIFTSNTSVVKGGAIHSIVGELNISDSKFTGNTSENGGAIRVEGVSATITNTLFDANKAISSETNYAQGAAIFNNTTLTLDSVTFKNNEATGNTWNARGGAIENANGKTINIINSTFDSNKSVSGKTAYGGAIYNDNGTINISATEGKNTVFSNNLQNGVSNAINNAGDGVVKGVVTFNSDDDSQIISYDTFTGSGAYYLQSGNLSLQTSKAGFSSTRLNVSGGKISTIDDVIRRTNLGVLTLNADLHYGIDVDLSAGTGDSIANSDTNFNANGNKIIIDEINIIADGSKNVTLTNNSEIKAAITLDEDLLQEDLIGIAEDYNVIGYDNSTGILSFILANLKGAVNSPQTQRIYTMTENEIVTETLGDMGGTKLSISGLNTSGDNFEIISTPSGLGGIITSAGQTLNISDVSKISGFSTTGDGGFIDNSGNLSVDNVAFEDNHATNAITSRGGVINNNAGSLDIQGSTFNNNTATFAGGAIAIFGGSIKNIVADFTENGIIGTARALGGAIYLNQNAEKIEGTFKGNYVTSTGGYDVVGGAIALMTGTIKSLTADFLGNYVVSTGDGYAGGGAIRTYTNAEINIFDSSFVGNYVVSNDTLAAGGAIFSHVSSSAIGTDWTSTSGATTDVTDSNFFDNYVKTTSGKAQGGAVYLETVSDVLNVNATNDDVYFSGNYTQNGSTKDFNAVHLYAGKMSLTTTGDNQIIFNDGITAEKAESSITIAGNVVFNDVVSNTSISLNSGQIDINQYNTYNEVGYTGVGAHELEFNTDIFDNINLTMASNTVLNAINDSATDTLNFEELTINGNAKISLDASLLTGAVDTINATTSSGTLVLDTIKLITDSTQKTVQLDITNSNININTDSLVLDTSDVDGYYKYSGYNTLTGILSIGRLNLAEVVALDEADKIYTLIENEIVAQNLGTLVNNSLDIIGTGTDYIINGQKAYNGITVGAGKELNVTDVKNITGFISSDINTHLGSFIINSGTTNITNSNFSNNSSSYAGGVIRNQSTIYITESTFTNNAGGTAGSAVLSNTGSATITNSTLSNNTKNAIGNVGTVNIFGSTFANNINNLTTENYTGGAINNYGIGTLNINKNSALNTLFENNSAVKGGAISNTSTSASTINNATFDGNSAQGGGAIYNTGLIVSITNSTFENNESKITSGDSFGGAIYNTSGQINTISAAFKNNSVESTNYAHGGAIYNAGGSSIGTISGIFDSNSVYATSNSSAGGAIFNRDKITSITANFDNNTSTTGGRAFGGAIYNTSTSSIGGNEIGLIKGNFDGNKTDGGSQSRGGAIWNSGVIKNITGDFLNNSSITTTGIAEGGAILNSGTINLFDSSFTKNTATGATAEGGAIWNSGTLSITAQTENVVFSGNKANGVSNVIYNEGTVNFATVGDNKIISYDGFSGDGTYKLAGNLYLLGANANFIGNSSLVIAANSMINTIDDETRETNLGNVTLEADTKWGFDVNLDTKESDVILGTPTSGSNGVILSELNLLEPLTDIPTLIEVIADDTLASKSYLSDDVIITADVIPSEGVLVEYLEDSGKLSFNLKSLNAAFFVDVDEKAYMLGSDEDSRTATADLGALVGTSLSISGNGLNILGGGFGGASVAAGQVLTFNDVSSIDGFSGNFVENSGQLNIVAANHNSALEAGASIYNNNAIINFKTQDDNTITLNNNIDGVSGDINIEGDVIVNANIFNNDISLKSGTLSLGQTAAFDNVGLLAYGGSLNLANGKAQDTTFDFISLNSGSLDVALDVDLGASIADKIITDNATSLNDNKINIKDLYIISDANEIETTVNIASDDVKKLINFTGVSIHDDGLREDYETGYLIGYSKETGDINFSYATLETAFSSSVETKAYKMVEKDEDTTTALILNGNSLDIDANGFEINASDINVNDKTLGITNAVINSTISGGGTLNFDGNITINSNVSGFSGVTNLNGGVLSVAKDIEFFTNTFNIANTPTLNVQNGGINVYDSQNWNLNSNLNVMIDVNLVDETADSFVGLDFSTTTNAINISSIFITEEKKGQSTISITNKNGGGNFTINSDQLKIVDEIYEYKYNIDDSLLASEGFLTFVDTEYKEFNSGIIDSIVAKQSQYLSSISVYKEAFANFGTQSPLPYRNLSSGDSIKPDTIWFRPFGKNEDVNLDNGYTIDNEAYGALFGIDAPMMFYDNCWNGLYSLYAGYMNSTQKYDDVKIEQDGFVVGFRALFERMNFFSGITANVSASFADANNMFGKEDFSMYSTGIANKTGYNFGFENNKYVIQPSLMLSYTYIHTPGYHNSSDVKISKQNLHALQITPELKFIKNLESNRQIYVGANYNWNLIDSSNVTASDVALPNVAIDPYAEFRLGTSKRFDNEVETFAEITASSGGREGIGFELGIKFEF